MKKDSERIKAETVMRFKCENCGAYNIVDKKYACDQWMGTNDVYDEIICDKCGHKNWIMGYLP